MKTIGLTDEKIACNHIKAVRQYCKRYLHSKAIYIPLFKEEDSTCYSILNYHHNTKTSVVSGSVFMLRWKGKNVGIEAHKKLKCINTHALEQLEKNRDYQRQLYTPKNNKKKIPNLISFSYTFCTGVVLKEYIRYNEITGNVIYSSRFSGNNGYNLKIVDDA